MEVSVIIPNYNGIAFLDSVLGSLEGQTARNFEVIFVDNGSTDGSCSFVAGNYSWVHIIELPENYGFCRAVNEGIRAAKAPYVLLLNNDTEVAEDFVEQMLSAIRRHKNAFSCWMMQEIITALLGGLLPEEKEKISTPTKRKCRFLPPAAELLFTEKKYWKKSGILMKNILRIWRIRILDTGPEFTAMKTGMLLKRWFIMWEAAQAVPGTTSLRQDILPETMYI